MRDSDVYCTVCGSRDIVLWQPVTTTAPSTGAPPVQTYAGAVLATRWQRIGAFALDLLIAILISLLGAIPVVNFFITFILILYWLFRDSSGASIGKRLLGIKVLSKSGQPASKSQLMLRNLPFVAPSLLELIPTLGFLAESGVGLIICLIELILLLATRNRIGDRIAGTMVVKA